jgi:hypothetical protein
MHEGIVLPRRDRSPTSGFSGRARAHAAEPGVGQIAGARDLMAIRASLIIRVMAAVSIVALPSVADAQPAGKMPRVGYLSAASASDPQVQRALDVCA